MENRDPNPDSVLRAISTGEELLDRARNFKHIGVVTRRTSKDLSSCPCRIQAVTCALLDDLVEAGTVLGSIRSPTRRSTTYCCSLSEGKQRVIRSCTLYPGSRNNLIQLIDVRRGCDRFSARQLLPCAPQVLLFCTQTEDELDPFLSLL